MSQPLSPDCRDGNPTKCDGTAWDEDLDELTACTGQTHSRQRNV